MLGKRGISGTPGTAPLKRPIHAGFRLSNLSQNPKINGTAVPIFGTRHKVKCFCVVFPTLSSFSFISVNPSNSSP